MAKPPKGPALPELIRLRAVLAYNLRAHMGIKYGRDAKHTTIAEQIAAKTGVGKNTVLRAIRKNTKDAESDMRLDTLVRLADHFNVDAIDLLHDHGMVHSLAPTERHKKTPTDAEIAQKGHLHRRPG